MWKKANEAEKISGQKEKEREREKKTERERERRVCVHFIRSTREHKIRSEERHLIVPVHVYSVREQQKEIRQQRRKKNKSSFMRKKNLNYFLV